MRKRIFFIISMLVAITLILSGCEDSRIIVKEPVTYDNALDYIDSLNIDIKEVSPVKGEIPERSASSGQVIMYELPDIENYSPIVIGKAPNNVEILLPLEDNNSRISKVVEIVANKYNQDHDGTSSVTIRTLDPSLANDFIKSGVYLPKGYIVSNDLQALLIKEKGIRVSKLYNKLAGNTIGIVLKSETSQKLKLAESENKFDTIFKSVMNDEIKLGYPNPTNNPTGLNFVISMLSYFDSTNPFSMEASTDFSAFQRKVIVAYSTSQLIEAMNRGLTDGFVMEYEAFKNNDNLKGLDFVPFGVRNDYPLYTVGDVSEEETLVLKDFANLFEDNQIKEVLASNDFNQNDDYVSSVKPEYYDGLIGEVLDYWKTEKKSGKKVAVYFVCDISGSMGSKRRLETLKESALDAMQYISEDNLVGLISFNQNVFLNLPLGEFNKEQQEYYAGSIRSFDDGGGTATNNALLQTLKLLDTYYRENPEIIPMIFLLSDGETESGYSLKSVKDIIAAFDIPIYTIGYEANIKELKEIANINNGVFINASTDDVGYILKSLFDAQT